jgi:hypothetical protein
MRWRITVPELDDYPIGRLIVLDRLNGDSGKEQL